MDVVDKATRSRMMAGIGGRNTRPEIIVRRALHAAGFRFRLHRRDLPGRPDLVLPRHQVVVFVHGCFWHRHEGCRLASMPTTNRAFWEQKFNENTQRDRRALEGLLTAGWRVAVVWECSLKPRHVDGTVEALSSWITGKRLQFTTLADGTVETIPP